MVMGTTPGYSKEAEAKWAEEREKMQAEEWEDRKRTRKLLRMSDAAMGPAMVRAINEIYDKIMMLVERTEGDKNDKV